MTPLVYRLLIAASTALGLAGAMLDVLLPALLPAAFTAAMEAQGSLDSTAWLLVGGAIAVAGLAAMVGLWLFRPWAPRWALATTALSVAIFVPQGANAVSGWSMALTDLSSMLWGAVLALTFFSPLSARFARVPG
jgi:hypothetical protein